MKVLFFMLVTVMAVVPPLSAQSVRLRLATTTSTQDSGLLDVLNPPFEKLTGITVDVIAVGTGKAITLGQNGDVDVLLVHDRKAEDLFVSQGYGVNRRDVMHNDFVIIGPVEDPAGVATAGTAAAAFTRIAAAAAPFVSRGDSSGTHVKEQDVWTRAGGRPQGRWYKEVGQGMGAVLTMAADLKAYTLADRGTWLAMKDRLPGLRIVSQGDPFLFNPYGVIAVNPQRWPRAAYQAAMQYVAWLTSPEGQRIIRDHTLGGQPLFFPDAIP